MTDTFSPHLGAKDPFKALAIIILLLIQIIIVDHFAEN